MNGITHIAGPVVDCIQRCTRCGIVLKDSRVPGVDCPEDTPIPWNVCGGPYPEGAEIERGPNFQAMVLSSRVMDFCQLRTPQQVRQVARGYAGAVR